MSPRISIPLGPGRLFDGSPPPVLDPAGPYAGSITLLSWVLFAIAALVLAVVGTALWIAFFGKARTRQRLGGTMVVWAGGIVFPVVVLTALLVWGLSLTASLSAGKGDVADLRVRVTGEMWWWRVAYLDGQGREGFQDANEIHIPTGRPVLIELDSADVIHSFWVPRLSGKVDMIPGRRNVLRLQADEPGAYGGQCAEYCGGPHALMGLVVVAHEPAEFSRLLAHMAAVSREPKGGIAAEGQRLFDSAGCSACHRIAGTGANGLAGPDLTFVGRRRTLGAGILPNNRGTMMGWIGDSQAIKPGNRMPAYRVLSADHLQSLAAYLEQQK